MIRSNKISRANCHFIPFTVHYEDAILYKVHHRNVEPPTFNEARLNEEPIPFLGNEISTGENPTDESSIDENINDAIGSPQISIENESVQNASESVDGDNGVNDENGYDNLFNIDPEDEINGGAGEIEASDPLQINTAQFEIKQEHNELVENHAENDIDIDELLENSQNELATNSQDETLEEVKVDDDLSIIVGKSGIPKPKGMRYKLVKREKDPFSGSIPYDDIVSIIYQ